MKDKESVQTSQKSLIRKIVSQELQFAVKETVKEVLETKRSGRQDEDESVSILGVKGECQRGTGSKCLKRRKHTISSSGKGVPSCSRRKVVQSSMQDGQSSTAYDDGQSYEFGKDDDRQGIDEYILDLDYQDGFEEESDEKFKIKEGSKI
ncbi:hypothetical protein NDU88_007160 [Pleurodeles waltl]|uniref:Uncharacterized protein n=1 Tax=Pleurodeles waltl TaxID=8319 RepID=A0AAV7N5K9_PLEWA|nr:hypothetical protein NDU88_007160 [Pleurodeles waltl]